MAALVAWIKIPPSRSTLMACFPANDACEVIWTGSSSVAAERLWDAFVYMLKTDKVGIDANYLEQKQLSRDGAARRLGAAAVCRELGVASPLPKGTESTSLRPSKRARATCQNPAAAAVVEVGMDGRQYMVLADRPMVESIAELSTCFDSASVLAALDPHCRRHGSLRSWS